jgi:L-threonylcarbamoyladenylate synthase
LIISQSSESISLAAGVINRGGVIAFRTDTFYGLGADPFNQPAVQKIRELKGREDDKPILVLISDQVQLERLISPKSDAFASMAERFWPGPLTIIGTAHSELPVEITAGSKTVGVRLPDDDKVRSLVRRCGGTLTATSANPSGKPPARTAAEVQGYFGDRIELIVDSGAANTDQPSTVIDVTGTETKLIREGVIEWSVIKPLKEDD